MTAYLGLYINLDETLRKQPVSAGWVPGAMASAMPAARTPSVREHAEELVSLVQMTKADHSTESMQTVKEGH